MARIDWNAKTDDLPAPGIYLAEIKSCEERTSGNGNAMFVVKLVDVDHGHTHLCDDLIMLAGKGWRFGKEKLYELNVPTDKTEIHASELVGLRVYVAIKHEVETYISKKNGDPVSVTKAKVNIEATSPWSGYWSALGEKPEGYVELSAPF